MKKNNVTRYQPTVAAVSTPIGAGGISVIRISGEKAVAVASKLLTEKKEFKDKQFFVCGIQTDVLKDKAVILYFRAPNSYTGEDVVEIQCHGNCVLAENIVNFLLKNGAEAAEAGEFTRRAFLNGKLDLTAAEGTIDFIKAQSVSAAKAAYRQISGELYRYCQEKIKTLTDITADASAAVDYPEDDIIEAAQAKILNGTSVVLEELKRLKSTFQTGVMQKNGVKAAIVGATNVGKSALLNRLLGYERAIVSSVHGTTRDTVEESFSYKGAAFILTDTAGFRDTDETVEKIGIERSRAALKNADLILSVFEKERTTDATVFPPETPVLFVANKSDVFVYGEADFKNLPIHAEKNNVVAVSAKTGENISALKEKMYQMTVGKISGGGIAINNARHLSCIENAVKSLTRVKTSALISLDCMLSDLNDALRALCRITGQSAGEEVVRSVFEKFCVGK